MTKKIRYVKLDFTTVGKTKVESGTYDEEKKEFIPDDNKTDKTIGGELYSDGITYDL